jgi:hypothetical protein
LLGTGRLRLGWRVCVGVVAASIKCAEIFSGIWVFGAKVLPGQAGCLSAGGARSQLCFTGDFGHFRGYFLPQRRSIKFQQVFNFVFREVLVVDSDQLVGDVVRIEFLLEFREISVRQHLRAVVIRRCFQHFLAVLLSRRAGRILNRIARTNQFQQRMNLFFLDRIDRSAGLRAVLLRSFHRSVRSSLNGNQECSNV